MGRVVLSVAEVSSFCSLVRLRGGMGIIGRNDELRRPVEIDHGRGAEGE